MHAGGESPTGQRAGAAGRRRTGRKCSERGAAAHARLGPAGHAGRCSPWDGVSSVGCVCQCSATGMGVCMALQWMVYGTAMGVYGTAPSLQGPGGSQLSSGSCQHSPQAVAEQSLQQLWPLRFRLYAAVHHPLISLAVPLLCCAFVWLQLPAIEAFYIFLPGLKSPSVLSCESSALQPAAPGAPLGELSTLCSLLPAARRSLQPSRHCVAPAPLPSFLSSPPGAVP